VTAEPADSYALGRSKALDVGSGAGDVALLLAELVGSLPAIVGGWART
jgi:ubiquinone/menaquinone biosynthesis C-methylase UbiE